MTKVEWSVNFYLEARHHALAWIWKHFYSYSLKVMATVKNVYAPPPFKKGGAYYFAHVGRCVSLLYLVQVMTQERFAKEASNLVGR